MQTPLHAAVATPSQQRAAAARRERERKIAARARPDSEIACPSATVRSQQAATTRPAPTPPEARKAWSERQRQMDAPRKTWFWIVDEIQPALPLKLSIEEIQAAVARHCKVTRAELISARRNAAIVRPRQIAMFLARHLTLHSLPVIGRKFGNRDHTTVLHAVRKIERLRLRDETLAADLETLGRALAAQVA